MAKCNVNCNVNCELERVSKEKILGVVDPHYESQQDRENEWRCDEEMKTKGENYFFLPK